jgi:hypothetical protein
MDISTVDTSSARLPSRYHAAKAALRDCSAVDECKEWADKASALASYAKQAGDTQLEDMAKRIRARAMRRAGELLKQVEPQRGANQNIKDAAVPKVGRAVAASEAGFSERQAKTAQRLASIPEGDFEKMVEGGSTVTQMAVAGTAKREPNRNEANKLVAAVKRYAKALDDLNMDEALDALSVTQRAEVRMVIGRLDHLHDRIVTSVVPA